MSPAAKSVPLPGRNGKVVGGLDESSVQERRDREGMLTHSHTARDEVRTLLLGGGGLYFGVVDDGSWANWLQGPEACFSAQMSPLFFPTDCAAERCAVQCSAVQCRA